MVEHFNFEQYTDEDWHTFFKYLGTLEDHAADDSSADRRYDCRARLSFTPEEELEIEKLLKTYSSIIHDSQTDSLMQAGELPSISTLTGGPKRR